MKGNKGTAKDKKSEKQQNKDRAKQSKLPSGNRKNKVRMPGRERGGTHVLGLCAGKVALSAELPGPDG